MSNQRDEWNWYNTSVSNQGLPPPHPVLQKYIRLVPANYHVLDVGVGCGSNALFLAINGHKVIGLDVSNKSLEITEKLFNDHNQEIILEEGDISGYPFDLKYSLIIFSMVLQFLDKSEALRVVKKATQNLVPNGLVFLSVFSKQDPLYKKQLEHPPINNQKKASFYDKEEVLELCKSLELIHIDEAFYLDLNHGDPHYHGVISFFGHLK
jgi:SAM-dependent methyltransferase